MQLLFQVHADLVWAGGLCAVFPRLAGKVLRKLIKQMRKSAADTKTATGIVVIFNQFAEQIFYQHIFRDNTQMFVLKIFKYLHWENNCSEASEASEENESTTTKTLTNI